MKKAKHSRQYNKMVRIYKKKLVKNAKETYPWDFKWLIEAIILNIEFMHDYYTLGENVMALETYQINTNKKDMPTRAEMCAKILRAYNRWQNYQEKFYMDIDQSGFVKPLIEDKDANEVALNESYEELKDNFFSLLSKYLDELWD